MTTTLDEARAATATVGDRVRRTELVPAPALSRRLGVDIRLKRELDQPTGSFKVRGVFHAMLTRTPRELARGVLAFSAGNHAAAVAYAAGTLGVPATVCMPGHAVARKVEATRALGAEVVLVERDLVGTAMRIADERGLTLIHPFDDPAIVAGHAGVGLEIASDAPDTDLVVVPVGGGGLISGVAAGLAAAPPGVRIVGVEPEGADVVSRSLAAGAPQVQPGPTSVADGLTAPITGAVPFAHIVSLVDRVVRVSDDDILTALGVLISEEGVIAEPAAAAGLAALLTGVVPVAPGRRVVLVVSGGNVNPALVARYAAR